MPTPLSYHIGHRGFLGFLNYLAGSDGITRGGVIPAVSLVDSDGTPYSAGGGGGGGGAVTVADGADITQGAKADAAYAGTGAASVVAILKGLYAALVGTLVMRRSQATVTQAKITIVAATAQTLFAASATANGARVLNWTASPVYISDGTTGTPASGAPSDYVPAAASGVPGQYETPYAPVNGLRAVGASAGDLTVETW